jgi:uncharacterized protein YecE (DUF72 family)
MRKKVWIGTSGYIYPHWREGVFYPSGLPGKKWFEYYCSQFDTLEVNTTFYHLARIDAVKEWYRLSPPGFTFFVKGSRFVTHMKKLNDPMPALRNFFRPLKPLKEKLVGVLWQFPPSNFKVNPERLERFLKTFRKFSDARLVLEFREPSWFCEPVDALLREFNAAYCHADAPDFYRSLKIPETARLLYLRRHGPPPGMGEHGSYADEALRQDAELIKVTLKKRHEVFVYFNNDLGGHAPRNARRLLEWVNA